MDWRNGKGTSCVRYVTICLLLVFVLAPLAVAGGCAKKEASPEVEIPSYYTTFTDEAGLFRISYPQDWEPALSLIPDLEVAMKDVINSVKSDAPVEKTRALFFAGLRSRAGYVPNVNIVVESLPGVAWTHDKVLEAEIRGVTQVVKDYREFSRVKATVDGREATIVEWAGALPQVGESHVLQMYVLVGKAAWIATCTPPSGEFSKWEKDFQTIMRSLRIMK